MKIIVQTDSVSELKEMAQQILGLLDCEQEKTEDRPVKTTLVQPVEGIPEKVTPVQPIEENEEAVTEDSEPPFDTDENNVPELSEVRLAVKALQEAVGKEQTKELLAKYKAKGASSVPEESRADFIKDAMEVING